VTDDIVQRILHLYDSVMIRHGVMIVGSTITGKTTSINCLFDTLNKSRDNEFEEKLSQYKFRKAKRLGLAKQESDYEEDEFKEGGIDLSPEEIKMLKA
jgi:septin family protein